MKSRAFLIGTAVLALAACKAEPTVEQAEQATGAQEEAKQDAPEASQSNALADLEKKSGGRLGVFILDTGTGKATGNRADERFALASTFKLSLAALILKMADDGTVKLDEKIPYTKADLMPNSPVTEANVAKGSLTVEELAKGTQVTSDNAAANLLLNHIGGPAKVTAFWRSLGDETSRLDEVEGELNTAPKDKADDTTTPQAMASSVAKILAGDALSPTARAKLLGWTEETVTGKGRIRAGLPAGWRIGHKTGTQSDKKVGNQINDVAIIWRDGKPPIIVAAYYEPGSFGDPMNAKDEAVLASVGKIAAEWKGD